jgi:integrase
MKEIKDKWTPKYIRGLVCPEDKPQMIVSLKPDIYLAVLVSKKSKTFVYRRKWNGTTRQIKLAEFVSTLDDTSLRLGCMAAAVSKASQLTSEMSSAKDAEINPFDEIREARQSTGDSVRALFNEYLEKHIIKHGKNDAETEKNFDRWFPALADRKAKSVTRSDAERFHAQIKKDRGPYAANRAVQLGRAMFYKTLKDHPNPFAGITLYAEEPRNRFLSDDEAGKLIKRLLPIPAAHGSDRTLRDFILLDMMTGVRKTNLLSMEWSEIDSNERTWTIPSEKAKNRSSQVIRLGVNEIEIIEGRRKLLEAEGLFDRFVFPGPGRRGHIQDLKKSWTTLRRNVGLEDITLHDLRRSLASAMASKNVNVALIKGVMSHKDMKTTLNVYARTGLDAQLEARQVAHAGWFKVADESK